MAASGGIGGWRESGSLALWRKGGNGVAASAAAGGHGGGNQWRK